ncbi:bromodomain-containing protein [Striga asiatica]|uniref:Bromodomain-containing protein n=1 Tax=Striga asiatica TaxID=4170 RepID=A0A5A7QAN6_STRAF|nr:bromodomain-containing protein [Striga asiatica]
MASAVLVSQKESSWGPMGKNPYSNPHLNANPNPNPKKKQKQFHHAAAAANGVAGGRFYGNVNSYHNFESPAVTQTASDDAYSFNQTTTSRNVANYGGYVSFNVASYTKSELLELRKRLSAELNQIRDLRDRIQSGQLSTTENPRSQVKSKKSAGNKRPGAVVASTPKNLPNAYGNGGVDPVNWEMMLKECGKIVAKLIKHKFGYIFKVPVDAVAMGLHDYHLIVKRPMDLGTVKTNLARNLYRTPMEFAADMRLTFNNALLYNPKSDPVNGMAEQLLAKFEDLYKPIQEKIDSSLEQQRELEACDFRAVDELHYRGFDELQGSSWNNHGNQVLTSPVRGKKGKPKSSPVPISEVLKKPDRLQAHSSASTASNPPPSMIQQPPLMHEMSHSPVRAPALPPVRELKVGRGAAPKLPKPKAKDIDKRDMSMDEKQKLGMGLQSLPQEKMPQLVQIIRKRNRHLAQDGDEIELDIEALDKETLWELDRFVTNWKKMVSKTKRQALMNTQAIEPLPPVSPVGEADMGAMSDKNDDEMMKKLKDNDDEDVDIDDDMPAASFPPVEIERDEGAGAVAVQDQIHDNVDAHHDHDHVGAQVQEHEAVHDNNERGNASSSSSSSGSSSSDSSSSSGTDIDSDSDSDYDYSDSGSSSGSDSDADDAQS